MNPNDDGLTDLWYSENMYQRHVEQPPFLFLVKKKGMNYAVTAAIAAISTLIVLFFYKFVINPVVVLSAVKTRCPDMWTYDISTKMCKPMYSTACLPFDPESSTLDSDAARCNVARSCGTTWSCP